MNSTRFALVVAAVIGVNVTSPNTARSQATTHYDGQWWRSVSADERGGFVDGYIDCYVYEYKGPAGFSDHSASALVRLIDEYYSKHLSDLRESVPSTLSRFRDRPGDTPAANAEGGEVHFEPHGYFDGTYWKGMSDSGRVGFVEGYVSCHADQSRNAGGVFKESPTAYRDLVSRWYGLNVETGGINAVREHEKVADVLYRVRSGSPASSGGRD
ncbi:MAG TPA: hypothetical protein VJT32_02805 [bacterium]|nr:hypothetical protein [bacterium]